MRCAPCLDPLFWAEACWQGLWNYTLDLSHVKIKRLKERNTFSFFLRFNKGADAVDDLLREAVFPSRGMEINLWILSSCFNMQNLKIRLHRWHIRAVGSIRFRLGECEKGWHFEFWRKSKPMKLRFGLVWFSCFCDVSIVMISFSLKIIIISI